MTNTFLFLSRKANIDLLAKHLQRVGVRMFEIRESESAYTPARVVLDCAPLRNVEVVFRRMWCSDGCNQEDKEILLSVDGAETSLMNVGKMLRMKLSKPLPLLIAETIAEAIERSMRSVGMKSR